MDRFTLLLVALLFALPMGVRGDTAKADAGANATKAVLVTGASTGIGRKITERLAADGYFVYAGARKDADLQALGAIKNVQPVRLDVTNPQDISAAVELLKQNRRGLYGLVNNAGIGTSGTVIDGSDKEFDLVMAVNVYGPYRVTKAFAPLIILAKGRIVTIGSISGILAAKNLSAYAMTKHAMEAFTDSLSQEMEPNGVKVSVVEPGNFKTRIANNAVSRTGADPRLAEPYQRYKEPDEVADAVAHALFDSNPKRRYLVVTTDDEAKRVIQKQLEQLVQLNEGHPFTYDRATLIKMLDAALSRSQ
jgi:NAD(P)-dependent dehydrogenase (short-subunit alcohol dehydrogenase family)